jgi:hypothetical protein
MKKDIEKQEPNENTKILKTWTKKIYHVLNTNKNKDDVNKNDVR